MPVSYTHLDVYKRQVLRVSRPSDSRQHRSLHGLTRALLNNMVTGVSAGFTRVCLLYTSRCV